MSSADHQSGGDHGGPSPRVAASTIRDAIEALKDERPDLAERLDELASELESATDEER